MKYHCKLELWDDDDGLEKGAEPDLVIDNRYFGTSKFIDSFQLFPPIRHLHEKISAYRFNKIISLYVFNNHAYVRCNCEEPDLTMKLWDKTGKKGMKN